MVRRGSTVRVRQRALKSLQIELFVVFAESWTMQTRQRRIACNAKMLPGHGEGMRSPGREAHESEEQLRRLYTLHGRPVLAYALRRTSSAEDAADAVAETFLVAWRRLDSVPS